MIMNPKAAIAPKSAPTRGPWIEIAAISCNLETEIVGPHTGAVD